MMAKLNMMVEHCKPETLTIYVNFPYNICNQTVYPNIVFNIGVTMIIECKGKERT